MERECLEDCLAKGMSLEAIGRQVGKHPSTVSYWTKKHELTAVGKERHSPNGTVDPERVSKLVEQGASTREMAAFFARREGGFRCAKCNSAAVSARRRDVKRRLVEEAGGCCRLCGFAEHPAALQFHHLDPTTKEFHLGHQGVTRSIARMRAEAKKCVLLCANCHALVEAGVKKVPCAAR